MMSVAPQKITRAWVIRQILFWLGLTALTTSVLVFSLTGEYNLEVGDVANQDIRSPGDVTYISEIRSEQLREAAVRQVSPVYTSPSATVARQQYDRAREVLTYLRELRADPYGTEAERYAWVLAVPELADLPINTANILLSLPETGWNRVQLEFLDLLDQLMRQQSIRADDLAEIQSRVPSMVALDLAQDEAIAVSNLVERFLKSNVFYDEDATETARQKARDQVRPVYWTLQSGEVVVREGNVISELDLEALRELGLTSQTRDWLDIGVPALFSATLALSLGVYLWRFEPQALDGGRCELLLLLTLAIFLWLARLVLPSGDLLQYLFPGAAVAMLMATTVGVPTAMGATVFLAGIGGWIVDHSLAMALIISASGVVAALTLPRYGQTGAIFRSGLWGGITAALVLTAFYLSDTLTDPFSLTIQAGVSLASGVVSAGLTVGGLFLLAPLFDLTTTFRLMELSRPNHPLLQRLLREAPATFNHVMMVASLAEQAAERIGADALLTRVGAYYHDVGKLVRPYFFVENQQGLSNPHDRLDPYASVDVLKGHIRDGQKLAKQYRLPRRVRAFIPEHHGTMRASFFYQKAVEAAGGEPGLVDEEQFRYPGPAPQSKETLLVMLADGSEAATRARRPSTPEELEDVITMIFDGRMRDGQMSECAITMQELDTVKRTYIELLRGAFHPRVKYPEEKSKGS